MFAEKKQKLDTSAPATVEAILKLKQSTGQLFGSGRRIEPELKVNSLNESKDKPIGFVARRESNEDISLKELWMEVRILNLNCYMPFV